MGFGWNRDEVFLCVDFDEMSRGWERLIGQDLWYWTFYPFNFGKLVGPFGILGNRELLASLHYHLLIRSIRCWGLGGTDVVLERL